MAMKQSGRPAGFYAAGPPGVSRDRCSGGGDAGGGGGGWVREMEGVEGEREGVESRGGVERGGRWRGSRGVTVEVGRGGGGERWKWR